MDILITKNIKGNQVSRRENRSQRERLIIFNAGERSRRIHQRVRIILQTSRMCRGETIETGSRKYPLFRAAPLLTLGYGSLSREQGPFRLSLPISPCSPRSRRFNNLPHRKLETRVSCPWNFYRVVALLLEFRRAKFQR